MIPKKVEKTLPNEACQYAHIFILQTPVGMTINSVLRDPSVFPSPSDFLPERWIASDGISTAEDEYFVAFGKGTRMCQGMK